MVPEKPEKAPPAVDLMAALEASLEAAKSGGSKKRATATKATATKRAASKTSGARTTKRKAA